MAAVDVDVQRDIWDWIVQCGSLVSAVGSVLALGFLIYQLRHMRLEIELSKEAALTGHFDATASRMLRADELFMEHPSTRRYVYGEDGRPVDLPASEKERDTALAVGEFLIDFLDTELLRQQRFPLVAERLPDFEPWVYDVLRMSTAVCVFLRTSWRWYSPALLARYADLASRDALAAPPDGVNWKVWIDDSQLSQRWRNLVSGKTHRYP